MSRTTYHYDDDGRLASAVTVHDPGWTEDDLEYALAWNDIRRDTHGPCGHRLSVTTDPRNRDAHEVVEIHTCDACQARQDYVDEQRDAGRPVSSAALMHVELIPSRRLEERLNG